MRRVMKNLLVSQTLGLLVALAGCEGHGVSGAEGGSCQDCQRTQYVMSAVHLPAQSQATRVGCDLNGDGQIDNALGHVMGEMPTIDASFDFQRAADDAFANGRLIVLLDVGTDAAGSADLVMYQGRHDPSDGLRAPDFYAGGGHFFKAGPGFDFGGRVSAGWADLDGARYDAELPMPMAQSAAFELVRGRVSGVISEAAIDRGLVCGAIPAAELQNRVIPAVADMLSAAVKSGNTTLKALFDADHSCDHDAACTFADAGVCHCISSQEFASTQWVRLLNPDLDLDPNVDNPFATGPNDPTLHNDALSFGFAFEARTARF
jgi:hypothetical protein